MMEEQILRIKSYNSDKFFQINRIRRYTNDKNKGRRVLFDAPKSDDYHMYYVSHGSLSLKNNGAAYNLGEFELFIYQPQGPQELISEYMSGYVHCIFSGKCAGEILDELELETDEVYHITPNYKSGEQYLFYNKQIEYVLAEYRNRKKYSELSSACMLIEFLSLYSRNRAENTPDPNLREIKQAVSYIIENVHLTINISDLLKRTLLSKSRFYTLFREYTGTSPLRFQLNYRLTTAADYLVIYDMKVHEVSNQLGFHDPLYFSRLFKKEFGVSPKTYIQLHKKHTHIQDKDR